eukprot:scaffold120288_cov69-Phaeocystis_antarctica.AAC.2
MVRDVRWCRDATMWCDVSRRITLIPVLVCSRVWHVACPREPGVRSRESANSFNKEKVSVKSYTLYLASRSPRSYSKHMDWRPRAKYPREQGARMPHATNTAIVLRALPIARRPAQLPAPSTTPRSRVSSSAPYGSTLPALPMLCPEVSGSLNFPSPLSCCVHDLPCSQLRMTSLISLTSRLQRAHSSPRIRAAQLPQ